MSSDCLIHLCDAVLYHIGKRSATFIGEGKGKNWWCVLYPPLCLSAAVEADTLSAAQTAVIQNGKAFAVKFKLLEYVERVVRIFKK